jgi:hypothetical protein
MIVLVVADELQVVEKQLVHQNLNVIEYLKQLLFHFQQIMIEQRFLMLDEFVKVLRI